MPYNLAISEDDCKDSCATFVNFGQVCYLVHITGGLPGFVGKIGCIARKRTDEDSYDPLR